jgi:hypothetical protein
MKLILLTFALVLFLLAAGVPASYEPWRFRILAFGLAAWVAAQYPF